MVICRAPSPISVHDAIQQGLLDEDKGTFFDPSSGRTVSMSDAIKAGLLKLSRDWPVPSGLGKTQQTPASRTNLPVAHQKGRGNTCEIGRDIKGFYSG